MNEVSHSVRFASALPGGTVAGRRLNAVQDDLAEKVRGFLSQAHEAIRANDWVRAQNLAEKAQVLSAELVKSF